MYTKLLEGELDLSVDYTLERESGQIFVELVAIRVYFGTSYLDVYSKLSWKQRQWVIARIESEVDLGSLISKD